MNPHWKGLEVQTGNQCGQGYVGRREGTIVHFCPPPGSPELRFSLGMLHLDSNADTLTIREDCAGETF